MNQISRMSISSNRDNRESHPLEAKGFSQQYYPKSVQFQIHSVNCQERAYRMHSRLRLQEKECSAIPFAHLVTFELSFHSVMFDTLKINLLTRHLFGHKRFGQVAIKLSDLPRFHGELLYSFPVVSVDNKDTLLGTLMLMMNFEFVGYPNFQRPRSLPPSDSFDHQILPKLKTEHSMEEFLFAIHLVPEDSKSVVEDRTIPRYRKKSSKEGLRAFKQLYAAVTQTGFSMNPLQFARGLRLLENYFRKRPTPKTFDVLEDDEKLRKAIYFMDFALPTYGAVLLNYFGYGKITDLFRINQAFKATVDHLKIEKENILAWEYDSGGIFSHKPCFFIVNDVNTQSIIVSLRGTFGVADAITDLNAEYVPFLQGSAHGGCLHAALWVKEHYLGKIKAWIKQFNSKGLYFVGHSLGGAISSILLMLLREEILEEQGPDFVCRSINFASPPCVTKNLIPEFEEYIETYANEYDIVPKASYGSFMDFKELLRLASRLASTSKLSKEKKFEELDALSDTLKDCNKHPRLFIPGQVFFMYKTNRIDPALKKGETPTNTGSNLIDNHEPHYVVERTRPENLFDFHFQRGMILYHMLNKYDNALRSAHDWLVNYKSKLQ